jgi:hypothetical protein
MSIIIPEEIKLSFIHKKVEEIRKKYENVNHRIIDFIMECGRELKKGDVCYIIRIVGTDYIKIGSSTNIVNRMRSFESMIPMDLEFIGHTVGRLQDEKDLHKILDKYRVKGEWFKITIEQLKKEVDAYNVGKKLRED